MLLNQWSLVEENASWEPPPGGGGGTLVAPRPRRRPDEEPVPVPMVMSGRSRFEVRVRLSAVNPRPIRTPAVDDADLMDILAALALDE